VYYLRVVGWAIPEFNLDACAPALRTAHDAARIWPVLVRQRCFLLVAAKHSLPSAAADEPHSGPPICVLPRQPDQGALTRHHTP